MVIDNSPLCCCEYVDVHEDRNHILLCCCNCQDFDEGFDSLVSGRRVPQRNRARFMATIHDRLRIPWKGGAKQISLEATVSIILVPVFLFVASFSRLCTVISGILMLIFLISVNWKISNSYYRNRFFHVWMNTSFVILYLSFEFIVIPLLEILWEENVGLTLLIVLSCFWFWKGKNRRVTDGLGRNCTHCMRQVPNDSKHVAWLNACIGRHNVKYYIFGLAAGAGALLYGSNLTLTTVCHPYIFLATILLPDDCSDAYDLIELSLSFVTGLYGLAIATYFIILFLHEIVLIILRNTCFRSSAGKKTNDNFIA